MALPFPLRSSPTLSLSIFLWFPLSSHYFHQMGLLYLAIKIPRALTLTFFLNIFSHARFLFIGALTRLGLYKPPPEEETHSRDNSDTLVLLLAGSSPALVPISVHAAIAAIKNRLPIVLLHDFLLRHQKEDEETESAEPKVCTICLEGIERSHEIRELRHCSHLFHGECLDTWIDEGQITCPLCRSMLLTAREIIYGRCNENRGGLQSSNAHLVAAT